ncbi:MAG: hypothetical protein P1U34_11215 [Coxiellaceae bacterium]|nr:hypothetical protein [Coxiellaceae bacterium]
MRQPTAKLLRQNLLQPQSGQPADTFFQGHRPSPLPGITPGIMFIAGALFSFSLATGLQDLYMPHFQNSGEKHVHSSMIEHLELPIITTVFATMLSITSFVLAKQATLPGQKKELHKRNLIAAGLGILPGALVGIMADLYNHRSHYDSTRAAIFCGVSALTVLGFFAACVTNCTQPLPENHALPPRIGLGATGMPLPRIDEVDEENLEQGTHPSSKYN